MINTGLKKAMQNFPKTLWIPWCVTFYRGRKSFIALKNPKPQRWWGVLPPKSWLAECLSPTDYLWPSEPMCISKAWPLMVININSGPSWAWQYACWFSVMWWGTELFLGPRCAPALFTAQISLALQDALLFWLFPSHWLPALPVGWLSAAQLLT